MTVFKSALSPLLCKFSRKFSLIAFNPSTCPETLSVTVRTDGDTIYLAYYLPVSLVGALSNCRRTEFQRKNELWKTNCLELFVGSESSPGYWEFNFSFTGDWNCYRFDSYRAGMREDRAAALCAFNCNRMGDIVEFHISTRVPSLFKLRPAFCPTAVIVDSASSTPHYFAPSHPTDKPDFHLAQHRVPTE